MRLPIVVQKEVNTYLFLKPVSHRVIFDYSNFHQQLKNYLESTTAIIDTYYQSLYDRVKDHTVDSF
jgi:hypothetical protein